MASESYTVGIDIWFFFGELDTYFGWLCRFFGNVRQYWNGTYAGVRILYTHTWFIWDALKLENIEKSE